MPAAATNVGATRAEMTGVVVAVRPAVFKKEDVLTPEMLRAVYEVFDKNHPAAEAATARARARQDSGHGDDGARGRRSERRDRCFAASSCS